MVATPDPFNMSLLTTRANPYPIYQQMLAEAPVHFNETTGGWYVCRYDDVDSGLRNTAISANRLTPIYQRLPEPVKEQFKILFTSLGLWTLLLDPPEHTKIRKLVSAPFVPRLVHTMRPKLQLLIDKMIDESIADHPGEFNVLEDIAYDLPATIISEMLGASYEDSGKIKEWSSEITNLLGAKQMTPEVLVKTQNAIASLNAYFADIIAQRREDPQDDLITALIEAEVDGEKLTEDQLQATTSMLIFAGHETTTNLIANAMIIAAQNPDLVEQILEDNDLIEPFIEEVLRYEAPVQRITRATAEDVSFGDVTIPAGQRVYFMLGAANRDPEHYENPDVFDINRSNKKHLSFGYGLHFCVGTTLGRAEAQAVVLSLLKRLPDLRLKEEIEWQDNHALRMTDNVTLLYRAD